MELSSISASRSNISSNPSTSIKSFLNMERLHPLRDVSNLLGLANNFPRSGSLNRFFLFPRPLIQRTGDLKDPLDRTFWV